MKMLPTLAMLLLCTQSQAGLVMLTWHSRANCINNESVTWDATQDWDMQTFSYHFALGSEVQHTDDSGRLKTWRSPAICWGESLKNLPPHAVTWIVEGQHQLWQEGDPYPQIVHSAASDCSIYDGWWGGGEEPDHPTVNKKISRSYADFLQNFTKYSAELKNKNSPTGIRDNLSDITLAFKPYKLKDNILGYAPGAEYIKNSGWTAVKTFFKMDGNTCSLSQFNFSIHPEDLKSQKPFPHNAVIKGNADSGYLYTVTWYTKSDWMILDCENRNNNPVMLDRMIKMVSQWIS